MTLAIYGVLQRNQDFRIDPFGIDHFAAVSLNPKETEDTVLAKEVIDGLDAYLSHARCVALGEMGFNLITRNAYLC